MSSWSSESQEQTRKAVENLDFDFLGHSVAFKNVDGRFGMIPVSDLLSGRLKPIVRRSEDIETFADAQQFNNAGWVID